MGLYLLIWGEAANLRFMPECLSYIYHHVCVESIFLISVQTYIWLSYAIVGPQAQLSMLKIFVALCSSGCLVGYGKSRMPRMCGRGAWSWVRFLHSILTVGWVSWITRCWLWWVQLATRGLGPNGESKGLGHEGFLSCQKEKKKYCSSVFRILIVDIM